MWRQNAGMFYVTNYRECPKCHWVIPRRAVRGAPDGAADLSGICSDGKRIEIEVKTLVGKQRLEQANFQNMIRSSGGYYFLVRSAEDALQQLKARGIIS